MHCYMFFRNVLMYKSHQKLENVVQKHTQCPYALHIKLLTFDFKPEDCKLLHEDHMYICKGHI